MKFSCATSIAYVVVWRLVPAQYVCRLYEQSKGSDGLAVEDSSSGIWPSGSSALQTDTVWEANTITRRISRPPDSKYIYAAVADLDWFFRLVQSAVDTGPTTYAHIAPAVSMGKWRPVAEVKNSLKTSKKFILVLYFAAQSATESEAIYCIEFAWSSNCSLSRKNILRDGGKT